MQRPQVQALCSFAQHLGVALGHIGLQQQIKICNWFVQCFVEHVKASAASARQAAAHVGA